MCFMTFNLSDFVQFPEGEEDTTLLTPFKEWDYKSTTLKEPVQEREEYVDPFEDSYLMESTQRESDAFRQSMQARKESIDHLYHRLLRVNLMVHEPVFVKPDYDETAAAMDLLIVLNLI
jgi:hypothetical protein